VYHPYSWQKDYERVGFDVEIVVGFRHIIGFVDFGTL
jgi:hypothetical protein